MSTSTYTPAPGSIADRAIAHLRSLPASAEIMNAALAEAIGTEPAVLLSCLAAARAAGAVFGRQRTPEHKRAPIFWSLTDHSNTVRAPAPAPEPAAQDSQQLAPTGEGKAVTPGAGTAEAAPNTQERGTQRVLKAEPERADATDRGRPVNTSPVGGPKGAGQPAAAGPAGGDAPPLVGKNVTLSLSGEIAVVAECGTVVLFEKYRARQLLQFLGSRAAS